MVLRVCNIEPLCCEQPGDAICLQLRMVRERRYGVLAAREGRRRRGSASLKTASVHPSPPRWALLRSVVVPVLSIGRHWAAGPDSVLS